MWTVMTSFLLINIPGAKVRSRCDSPLCEYGVKPQRSLHILSIIVRFLTEILKVVFYG